MTIQKLLARWPQLLLLTAILLMLGAGVYFVLRWLPDWEHRVLFAVLTLVALLFVLMLREMSRPVETAAAVEPIPDAASPEEQQAALDQLAELPQFRRLNDGTLFDYLQGITVRPCRCGEKSPFHLWVRYGKGRQGHIALVSRGALGQFLAVQVAVGEGLRRTGSANEMPAARVPAGGEA